MAQNDVSTSSTVVERQIEQLRNHPHIREIVQLKHLTYKIVYWPQDLDSLYSEVSYQLKLTLPENYPERPPFLWFLDKIYHLNIHPMSGQVFMSILKDDWSPFLNLKAIISSLDEILQNPDEQNAATTNILEEYQDDINNYVYNVKNALQINLAKSPLMNRNQSDEQIVQQVIQVKDLDYNKLVRQSPRSPRQNQNKKVKIADYQQSKVIARTSSKQLREPILIEHEQNIEQIPKFPTTRKNSSKQKLHNQNPQNYQQKQEPLFGLPSGHQKNGKNTIAGISSIDKFEEVVRQSNDYVNQNPANQAFDGLKLNMLRCKDLIRIFSQQLEQLQQQAQRNKSSKRLKKLYDQRCQKLQQMLIELFDISQKINLKLMDTVRKDFKKYS